MLVVSSRCVLAVICRLMYMAQCGYSTQLYCLVWTWTEYLSPLELAVRLYVCLCIVQVWVSYACVYSFIWVRDGSNTSVCVIKKRFKCFLWSAWFQVLVSWYNYLSNCTCYDKTVCTILFISRWWVYWYELFSVLSILQKWLNFAKTPSL